MHEVAVPDANNDDPLLLFLPEARAQASTEAVPPRRPAGAVNPLSSFISRIRLAVWVVALPRLQRGSLAFLRQLSGFTDRLVAGRLPARHMPTWTLGKFGAHPWGRNLSLVAFVCGAGVGALVTWPFGGQAARRVATIWSQPAPAATAASIPIAPAAPPDVSVSRETPPGEPAASRPAAPLVFPPVVVPAPPNQVRVSGPSARSRPPATARTPRVSSSPATSRPAGAPYRGSIAVHSEPQGAQVFVNGEPVGFTPLELKNVPAGSRAIRLQAEGYQRWSAAVRVVANQQTRVSATLHP
ncbi:MAG: PEGA domain-containing protein [Luteitalea sp.]|nr:PEGA domain-containing protein [Luteitalea sp.]